MPSSGWISADRAPVQRSARSGSSSPVCKDPIALQRNVAVYTEINSRHVAIPVDEKLQGRTRRPRHGPICRDLRRWLAKARRNSDGAALGAGAGPGSRWARGRNGCARRRCCWRSAPAASARPRRRRRTAAAGQPTPTTNSFLTSTFASCGLAMAFAPTIRPKARVSS